MLREQNEAREHDSKMTPIDRMFKEMDEKDISIQSLADKLGFPETSRISNWKKRNKIPNIMLADVACAIGVSKKWLEKGIGNKENHLPNSFAERFAEALMEEQTTLKDVSKDIGVPRSIVEQWGKDINPPQGDIQRKLAQNLGVSAAWLIYGAGPKSIESSVIRMDKEIRKRKQEPIEFLERIGISKKEYYEWQKNNIIPSNKLHKIAKALTLPADYLTEEDHLHDILLAPVSLKIPEDPSFFDVAQYLRETPNKTLINIYENIEASAGDGSVNGYEVPTDHLWVENKWLQEIVHFVPKDMAIIKVRGDSMEPTLSPGDMILIDRQPIERDQLNDGVYVINRGDTTHVKRLQCVESGIRIISDNKAYATETVTSNITICGRVIWAWKGQRF